MMSEEINALKEEERGTVAVERHSNNWIAGLALIALGAFFLFNNVTGISLFDDNWWAFFIFIPAISSFSRAWRSYQRHGRMTHSARHGVIGGLLVSTVALIFLFGLDWGLVWPVFLVIVGLGMFLKGGW